MRLWRNSAKQLPGLVSLGLEADGFGIAHVTRDQLGVPTLHTCQFCAADELDTPQDSLIAAVDRNGLRGGRSVVVLAPEDYSMRPLDAPDVPSHEMRAAIRWAIKDLVDFDVEHAVVDYFDVPGQQYRRGKRRIYAVIARRDAVVHAVEIARNSGLQMVAIDIAEMACRNLAFLHPRDEDGVVTVLFRPHESLITLTRAGELYMARWISTELSELARFEEEKSDDLETEREAAGAEEVNSLLLEIQRSIDYYQHELAQRAPAHLMLGPLEGAAPPMAAFLARSLDLSVDWMDLGRAFSLREPLAQIGTFRCLSAVGGALRRAEDAG